MIDLTNELTTWLRSTDARTLMKEIVAEAVQTEIRSALQDELIDVEHAAAILDMTQGALRKAVERGQIPCQRIGARLRFRRADLISGRSAELVMSSAKPGTASAATATRRSYRSVA